MQETFMLITTLLIITLHTDFFVHIGNKPPPLSNKAPSINAPLNDAWKTFALSGLNREITVVLIISRGKKYSRQS